MGHKIEFTITKPHIPKKKRYAHSFKSAGNTNPMLGKASSMVVLTIVHHAAK
jgi:hypothetical protein